MELLIPLSKVDEEKRLIIGRAVQEIPDRSGEIIDYESAKPAFEEWSKSFEEATNGLSKGNLRVMHGQSVAGKVTDISFNDADKAIDVIVKVVDDNEWQKVVQGCYTGFSVGGSYAKKWTDERGMKRYTPKVKELSLVDRPCIPSAKFFELQKADGTLQKVEFLQAAEEEPQKFQFNEELIGALKKRIQAHNEADDAEYLAKLHAVKTVFQRGVSAFNRGPVEGKTQEDFGMGRVEMYLGALAKADGVETHDPDLLPEGHPLRKSRAKTFGDLYKADGRKGRDGDGDGKLNEDGEGAGQGPRRDTSAKDDRSNVAVIPEQRGEAIGRYIDYGIGGAIGAAGGAAWASGGRAYRAWRGVGDAIYGKIADVAGGGASRAATATASTVARGTAKAAKAGAKHLDTKFQPINSVEAKAAKLASAALKVTRKGAVKVQRATSGAAASAKAEAASKGAASLIQNAWRNPTGAAWNFTGDIYRRATRANLGAGRKVAAVAGAAALFGIPLSLTTGRIGIGSGIGSDIDQFRARRVERTSEVGKADMEITLAKSGPFTFADLHKFDESKVKRDEAGRFTFKDGAMAAAGIGGALLAGRAAYAFAKNPGRYLNIERNVPPSQKKAMRGKPLVNVKNIVDDASAWADRNGLKAARRATVAVGKEIAAGSKVIGGAAKEAYQSIKSRAAKEIAAEVKEFKRVPISGKAGKIAGLLGTAAAAYGIARAIKDHWDKDNFSIKPSIGPEGIKAELRVGTKTIGEYNVDSKGASGFKYFGGGDDDDGVDGRKGRDADSDGKKNEKEAPKATSSTFGTYSTVPTQKGTQYFDFVHRQAKSGAIADKSQFSKNVIASESMTRGQKFSLLNAGLGTKGSIYAGNARSTEDEKGTREFTSAVSAHVGSLGSASDDHKLGLRAMVGASFIPDASKTALYTKINSIGSSTAAPQYKPHDAAATASKLASMGANVTEKELKSFNSPWEFVNAQNEAKGDSRRLDAQSWLALKQSSPTVAARFEAQYRAEAEKLADRMAPIANKSDRVSDLAKSALALHHRTLAKIDARTGRDGDGDGITNEKDKAKGGSQSGPRPFKAPKPKGFDSRPNLTVENLLSSAVNWGATSAINAAVGRYVPGGSKTIKNTAGLLAGVGAGMGASAVGAKIDRAVGLMAPRRKEGLAESIGGFAGGWGGSVAGAAAAGGPTLGVGAIAGAAAGGIAGQEIGAVTGRFIDKYGAKFASALRRRFFEPAKPKGRQANV